MRIAGQIIPHLLKRNSRWEFIGEYEDRHIPEKAGFWWDSGSRCWWTKDIGKAVKLMEYADRQTAEELQKSKDRRIQSIVNSKAVDSDMEYKTPAGLEYMPFQKAGIKFALERDGTLLADEMGLGKSIQSIGVINETPDAKDVLIITPASLKLNWKYELNRWLLKDYSINIIGLDDSEEKQKTSHNITICNYERLKNLPDKNWDILICDETHYLKSRKTQRTKYVQKIAKRAKKKLFLTGTPILNHPIEIYPVLNMLDPDAWKSYWSFAKRYCLPSKAPILMSDLSEKAIKDIKIGDKIIGWKRRPARRCLKNRPQRRLCESQVLEIFKRKSKLQKVVLEDDSEIICTPDHKWLSGRSERDENIEYQVARMGTMGGQGNRWCSSKIAKILREPKPKYINEPDYKLGYIMGTFRGDGYCTQMINRKTELFRSKVTEWISHHNIGVNLSDFECIERISDYLDFFHIEHKRNIRKVSSKPHKDYKNIFGITCGNKKTWSFFSETQPDTDAWWAGFLGGIYDTEGSYRVICQYIQCNRETYKLIVKALNRFGFEHSQSETVIRIKGGRKEFIRFWEIASPSIVRKLKSEIFNNGGRFMTERLFVKSINQIEGLHIVYTLKTTTGNYVAYGYGSKNCAAHNTGFGWDVKGSSNLGELQDRLRSTVMVRRLKKDVLKELPEKRRQIIVLPEDGMEDAIQIEREVMGQALDRLAELKRKKSEASEDEYKEAVQKLNTQLFIEFAEMSRIRHNTAMAKVPIVIEHVKGLLESIPRVVVMGYHKTVLKAISDGFSGISVMVHGDVPQKDRQGLVDRFQQDSECRVFIGSIKVAGLGFTLTAASVMVFAELDWTPGYVLQAEDRIHRIGQKDQVLIQHLVVDGTIDVRLARMIVDKQEIIDMALDDMEKAERMKEKISFVNVLESIFEKGGER